MSLKTCLAWMFLGGLSQDDLLRIAGDLLDERLNGMSGEEQAAFL